MQGLRKHRHPVEQPGKLFVRVKGGSQHEFAACACLDHMRTAQRFPARVGAVESYPEVDILIDSRRDEGVTGVHLMPLTLVAGDHAINAMASYDAVSWPIALNTAVMPATPRPDGPGEHLADARIFLPPLHQPL
ncbi:sirohydrochlorin cobaltochelatase, partial [Salmonella enterica]|uniref:sirohydrochlorin cobaltochelatase n=1 Tax=Salmonella enterica TaxID=28901 RepID=UPI00398C7FBF